MFELNNLVDLENNVTTKEYEQKTIFKYELRLEDIQEVKMPEGAEILSLDNQAGDICMWAMVAPLAPKVTRTFRIFGTGHPISTNTSRKFIGTAIIYPFVWHVFEIIGINNAHA